MEWLSSAVAQPVDSSLLVSMQVLLSLPECAVPCLIVASKTTSKAIRSKLGQLKLGWKIKSLLRVSGSPIRFKLDLWFLIAHSLCSGWIASWSKIWGYVILRRLSILVCSGLKGFISSRDQSCIESKFISHFRKTYPVLAKAFVGLSSVSALSTSLLYSVNVFWMCSLFTLILGRCPA